jgi:phosphatidyl-myo-inositol dimannoside synthase
MSVSDQSINRDLPSCLVISELFLPTKGGTPTWFAEVYRRLGGRNIHIVTADVPGAQEFDRNNPNSIHRIVLRRYRWVKPESLILYARMFWCSLKVGWRVRPRSIHAGRVLPEGMVAWCVARILRRPIIIYAHGEEITTWRTLGKRRAMIFFYLHADLVIANSGFTRDLLIELGVMPSRIRVINPGVDTSVFYPGDDGTEIRRKLGLHLELGQFLILSVGRLTRRKGFDQVIRSLPVLLEHGLDVHYAIIGTGEDREYLHALAEEYGISRRVHMLAHQSGEDLPRWYRAANLFVMPNREIDGDTEGFGIVFLEAAATGLPSIAGQAGGTGEAVVDGQTGLRVDGYDVQAVGDALWRLLSDPDYALLLGQQGLKRVRDHYAWNVVADTTMSVMSELSRKNTNLEGSM